MSCSTSSTVHAGADPVDQRDHALRFVRPHAGHRLVEQHEPRAAGEREPDLERALLAVRELPAMTAQALGQADLPASIVRASSNSTASRRDRPPEREARAAARLHREREVVEHGKAPEELRDLEGARQAAARALVLARARDVAPSKERTVPPSLASWPASCADQRGLAGAVRARSAHAPRPAPPRGRRGRWRRRRRSASSRSRTSSMVFVETCDRQCPAGANEHDDEQADADAEAGVLLRRRAATQPIQNSSAR